MWRRKRRRRGDRASVPKKAKARRPRVGTEKSEGAETAHRYRRKRRRGDRASVPKKAKARRPRLRLIRTDRCCGDYFDSGFASGFGGVAAAGAASTLISLTSKIRVAFGPMFGGP